jgi:molecular chaperone GrpE
MSAENEVLKETEFNSETGEKKENMEIRHHSKYKDEGHKKVGEKHIKKLEKENVELKSKIEKLESELEELRKQNEIIEDTLMRKVADFDNYRKRILKEKEEFQFRANENLILEILPVLDNFERGLKASEETKNFDALVEGIKMVHSSIHNLFEDYKVKPVESEGREFDHNVHQALNFLETDDEKLHNIIAEEFEKGYYMGDRVLRPAKVIVWQKKQKN